MQSLRNFLEKKGYLFHERVKVPIVNFSTTSDTSSNSNGNIGANGETPNGFPSPTEGNISHNGGSENGVSTPIVEIIPHDRGG